MNDENPFGFLNTETHQEWDTNIPMSFDQPGIGFQESPLPPMESFSFQLEPSVVAFDLQESISLSVPTVPEPIARPFHKKNQSTPNTVCDLIRIAASTVRFNIDPNNIRGLGHPLMMANVAHPRQHSLPVQSTPVVQNDDDVEFRGICNDDQIRFNPVKLGFIPGKFWNQDREWTFGQLVSDFFQKKNNANSRFSHKLYNALKISTSDPFYSVYIGVEWVNERVLKIDKRVFARLLGIKTIDGSLFHQQGNFPSHGFVELNEKEAMAEVSPEDLKGVDYETVRLLVHQPRIFTRDCTEEDIERCKWISTRKRS